MIIKFVKSPKFMWIIGVFLAWWCPGAQLVMNKK